VPFAGFDDKKVTFRRSKLPKYDLWGLNGHFKPNLQNFQIAISQSTNSINAKFEGEFQVQKWTSWVVWHYKIIIQDGGVHF